MKDEKQAEEFLRAKGLTGDFKTKRILTPEQGTLVEWFVEFANQDKVREAAEKVCCDNREITDQKFEVTLNDKDGSYIDINVDFCKNCGTTKDVWQYG